MLFLTLIKHDSSAANRNGSMESIERYLSEEQGDPRENMINEFFFLVTLLNNE